MSSQEERRETNTNEEFTEDLPDEELEALYRDHSAIRNWEPLASEVASYYFGLQDKGSNEDLVMKFASNFQAVLVGLTWK